MDKTKLTNCYLRELGLSIALLMTSNAVWGEGLALSLRPPQEVVIERVEQNLSVRWNAVEGAQSYKVQLIGTSERLTKDLIISEYIEGSSYNKYLEIYNGTGRDIDLEKEEYILSIYMNGEKKPRPYPLSGILHSGNCLVFSYSGSKLNLPEGISPIIVTDNFNGNDAIELTKKSVRIDYFGVIGNTATWKSTDGKVSAENMTLRRKSHILKGVTRDHTVIGTFQTLLKNEWDPFPIDNVSGLGHHATAPSFSSLTTVTTTEATIPLPNSAGNYTLRIEAVGSKATELSPPSDHWVNLGGVSLDESHTAVGGFVESLHIGEVGMLHIPEGTALRSETLTLSYGESAEEGANSTAGLLIEGSLEITNNIEVEMNLSSGKWHFIAFPFDAEVVRVNENDNPRPLVDLRICDYDTHQREANHGRISNFRDITSAGETNLILKKNRGYIVAVPQESSLLLRAVRGEEPFRFESDEETSTVEFGGQNEDATHNGWNLVGNPYLTHLHRANEGDWLAWDGGTYKLNNKVNSLTSYFIQTASDQPMNYLPSWRKPQPEKQSTSTRELLTLTVSDGVSEDDCHLRIDEEATSFYQIGKDLAKLFSLRSDVPQIYTLLHDSPMVLHSIHQEQLEEEIGLAIKVGKSGDHNINLQTKPIDGVIRAEITTKEGETIDLLEDSWRFQASTGEIIGATLKLHVAPTSHTNPHTKISLSTTNGTIRIDGLEGVNNIELHDLSGRLIAKGQTEANSYDIRHSQSGWYLVSVIHRTGRTLFKTSITTN